MRSCVRTGVPEKHRAVIIGLTGGFASGKSTVASLFRRLGAIVVDADRIGHAILEKRKDLRGRISRKLGIDLKKGDRRDRRRIAEAVFSDPRLLASLERVIHPAIIDSITRAVLSHTRKGAAAIVIDAPLLFEAKLDGITDYIVAVRTTRACAVRRALKRSRGKLTRAEIIQRIGAQLAAALKIKRSDFVIDNGGSRALTKREVDRVWRRLWR